LTCPTRCILHIGSAPPCDLKFFHILSQEPAVHNTATGVFFVSIFYRQVLVGYYVDRAKDVIVLIRKY
jgi:hypothetical protein